MKKAIGGFIKKYKKLMIPGKNIALRANKKATIIFFIEGACDRFLSSDFPVLTKKQIYMDGEQRREFALVI